MVSEAEAECDASRSIVFLRGCVYPEIGKSAGKSCGDVGEKFVRVVGFGALSDRGGFLLGLSIGGDNGNGVKLENGCLAGPDVMYVLPVGDVTVDGGERGIAADGHKLICGLTGFDRRGFGNVGRDIVRGEVGGDGVDAGERKVGPRSADSGDSELASGNDVGSSTGRAACREDLPMVRDDPIAKGLI
jgi:hypothetical protein